MRRYVLALLAVLLSGCAAHVATMKVGGLETSEGLRVRDIRPAQEKEAESFSHLVTSDAYGTFRVADAAITPSALRLLQHRAYEAAAGGKPPADVVVRHFVVYRNMQHVLRRGALAAGLGGIIGAVIAGSQPLAPPPSSTTSFDAATFNAAAASEYKLALVTDEQDPDGAPVYVVYIETEIDGLQKFTKTITPAVIQAAGATPLQGALDDAIKSHLAFKGGSVLAARSVLATAPAIAPAPAAAVVAMVPNTPARVPADSGTALHRVALQRDLYVGRTWIYPHPRDSAHLGNVEISFLPDGSLMARNNRSKSRGTYTVNDDRICADYESWERSCFFVVDEDGRREIVFAQSGNKSDLTIR